MLNPSLKNWLTFLYGLGAITQIRIIGAMGITELACLVASPFVLIKIWPKIREAGAEKLLLFLMLWFFSAVLTDYYRDSSTNNALRGIFAQVFLLADFVIAFALLWTI